MVAGTVLAKSNITASALATIKSGGNSGNGTITMDVTDPVLGNAKNGTYAVRCVATATNSGTFRVTSPSGHLVGDVDVGSTFANQIKFSIADGSPDFALGDGFDVTVNLAGSKWVALDPTASDGSQIAAGILFEQTDASTGDTQAVAHTNDCEIRGSTLTWPSGITSAQQQAAINVLATAKIIVR